jgi:multiple sugar transport system substrate-binding protein
MKRLAGAMTVAAGLAAAWPAAAEEVSLDLVLVSPADRWEYILKKAEAAYEASHPGTDLKVNAQILPFGDRLTRLRAAGAGGTPLDIVSLDQPEVGEFAAAGFTTDLTAYIERDLDGMSDWLPAYRDGTHFDGKWHAIWAWTDARVLWFWKDLVKEAGVDPATDMRTWEGYLESCKKLNAKLQNQGVEGCLLIGKPWVADWTLPYMWMQNGDIGQPVDVAAASKAGAAEAWVPTLDSQAWIDALTFTKAQVDAGVKPYTEHQFGPEFVSRRFATVIDGTWVYGAVANSKAKMDDVGLVAAFPTKEQGGETATMAGGWTLAIPSTSKQPDVAWEFLKAMLDVKVMGDAQAKFGYLPVRKSFATDLGKDFTAFWNQGGDKRWEELQTLSDHAYGRPNFPKWPAVGAAISEMVQAVMFNGTDPAEAAANAQRQVLDLLQWPEGTSVTLADDKSGKCDEGSRLVNAVTPIQKAADKDGSGAFCSLLTMK